MTKFPEGFLWGAATAAHQVEGNNTNSDFWANEGRVPGMEHVWVAGDAGSYPGPDWMAKQAHQADLQARAVAKNIAAELRGAPAVHGFKAELACIVDTLDAGMLVYRGEKRNLALPRTRAFHWLKQRFEARYLKRYR